MTVQQRSLLDFFPKKAPDSASRNITTVVKTTTTTTTASPKQPLQTSTDVRRYGGSKRQRAAVQTSLDFGQRDVAVATTCGRCGMFFNAAIDADIRLHRHCCTRAVRSSGAAMTHSAWLASVSLAKAFGDLVRPQRCGVERGNGNSNHSSGVFCTQLQESQNDEFVCYAMDCSGRGFAEDVLVSRLVEALQFADVVLSAASYTLVAVVHRRAERLVCAVAGRPSTRQQEPLLLLREPHEGGIPTRCYTKSSLTFCDVPYIWFQDEAVLASTAAEWKSTQTTASLVSTRTAVQDFFNPTEDSKGGRWKQQDQFRTLVDTALRRALRTLGRHVAYGHALCPRSQFSYDCGVLPESVLSRVDSITACSNAVPLYRHTDDYAGGASQSENDLSVVSYSDEVM